MLNSALEENGIFCLIESIAINFCTGFKDVIYPGLKTETSFSAPAAKIIIIVIINAVHGNLEQSAGQLSGVSPLAVSHLLFPQVQSSGQDR